MKFQQKLKCALKQKAKYKILWLQSNGFFILNYKPIVIYTPPKGSLHSFQLPSVSSCLYVVSFVDLPKHTHTKWQQYKYFREKLYLFYCYTNRLEFCVHTLSEISVCNRATVKSTSAKWCLVGGNNLVDPSAQVGHSGVHCGSAHITVGSTPGHNTHKGPHSTALTNQRTTRVTLQIQQK